MKKSERGMRRLRWGGIFDASTRMTSSNFLAHICRCHVTGMRCSMFVLPYLS